MFPMPQLSRAAFPGLIRDVFPRLGRRWGPSLAAVPMLLTALAGAAFAGRPIMSDPDPDFWFKGDSDNLPVNCRVTPEELVAHARRIAAVQTAMQEFARRGYVAYPGADKAASACDHPISVVMLAYQKPGAWIDSDHRGAMAPPPNGRRTSARRRSSPASRPALRRARRSGISRSLPTRTGRSGGSGS